MKASEFYQKVYTAVKGNVRLTDDQIDQLAKSLYCQLSKFGNDTDALIAGAIAKLHAQGR
jgi:hypothetical protein